MPAQDTQEAPPSAPSTPAAKPADVDEEAPAVMPPPFVPADAPDEAEVNVEAQLAAAKERGDQKGYLKALMGADLYLPVPPGEEAAGRYATAVFNDGTYVLTFSSPEAMRQAAGGREVNYRRSSFTELAMEWPNEDWQLAVNARLPSAAFIDQRTVQRIAEQARAAEVVVMQKVIRPEHVPHYLDGGYDWVAGYVHRYQDVGELDTPRSLIRGLGLIYAGSPFRSSDQEIHVIRWPVLKRSLIKTPYGGLDEETMQLMPEGWVIENPPFLGTGYAAGDGPAIREFKINSQRLPHGAQLYRLDRMARETLVAVFDADKRGWTRVEATEAGEAGE